MAAFIAAVKRVTNFGPTVPVLRRERQKARAQDMSSITSVRLLATESMEPRNRADSEDLQQLCVDLLLITLRQQIRAHDSPTDRIDFSVKIPHLPPVAMYALCTPGDTPEPLITVLLPHED